MKTGYYHKISNLNFIENKKQNKNIGIEYFKWIVKNSFFKFFNPKIKVDNKKTDLTEIRKEMTIAEISHLIAFIFVTVIALYMSISHNYLFGLTIMIVNILMNLYPSLLQQENKRRIDKIIKRQRKTVANKI
ncbi:hypothetical protein ACH3PA_18295 [Leeuwenhoekiella sp. A2]|uniref:glycosyl-4,4'-diaponeurosporenoate acyltransferase CrtO family protein n=1 Tax=Leeuwenhoekiella sp. A2 TaxID=3141460 RepID=UPI003A804C3A